MGPGNGTARRRPMIPLNEPTVGTAEAEIAAETVLSGGLTHGHQVAAFEEEFADIVEAEHACAVANCTAALHLALLAVGVGPGDEVVTASHSFIGAANAIRQCGARPVFADIDPRTYNLDPDGVAAAITPRTKAVVVVHQMGMPCDLAAIVPIARARGLPVIEDAACAIGSDILIDGAWEAIGRPHGDITCFSLHSRSVITAGDGGILTTSNPEWDARFRLWRQHGMSRPDEVRRARDRVVFEQYPVIGFNYRMMDVQAGIGRAQLRRLREIVACRRHLANNYREMLAWVPGVTPPFEPAWARSNWQSYCVRLPLGVDQRLVMQSMLDHGVATRRGIMCVHREEAYADLGPHAGLSRSEQAQDGCMLLPLFPRMTESMQATVVTALAESLAGLTA